MPEKTNKYKSKEEGKSSALLDGFRRQSLGADLALADFSKAFRSGIEIVAFEQLEANHAAAVKEYNAIKEKALAANSSLDPSLVPCLHARMLDAAKQEKEMKDYWRNAKEVRSRADFELKRLLDSKAKMGEEENFLFQKWRTLLQQATSVADEFHSVLATDTNLQANLPSNTQAAMPSNASQNLESSDSDSEDGDDEEGLQESSGEDEKVAHPAMRKRKRLVVKNPSGRSLKPMSAKRKVVKRQQYKNFMKKLEEQGYKIFHRGTRQSTLVRMTEKESFYTFSHVKADNPLEGFIFCSCCNKKLSWGSKLNHLTSASHKKSAQFTVEHEKKVNCTIEQFREAARQASLQGQTLPDDTLAFRIGLLEVVCKGNICMRTLSTMQRPLQAICTGRVPDRRLLEQIMPDALAEHKRRLKCTLGKGFSQFSLIFDASPYFAEALVVKIRFVVEETFEIKELLLSVKLYKKTLTGDELAKELLRIIEREYAGVLDLANWRACMIDRASTNKRAMSILREQHGVQALEAYCVPHGLANAGKKFDYAHGERVLKLLSKMVAHTVCKARTLFFDVFGEAARRTHGVRWYLFFEHAEQTDRIGLDRIENEYVTTCVQSKYSEKSSKKLKEYLAVVGTKAMAMVELAAVHDVGRPLCSATYDSESDGPLIFVACDILDSLRLKLRDGGIEYTQTLKAATHACEMMATASKPLRDAITTKTGLMMEAECRRDEAKAELERLYPQRRSNNGSRTSQREAARHRDYSALAGHLPANHREYEGRRLAAENRLQVCEKEFNEANEKLKKAESEYKTWCTDNLTTIEEFVGHGSKCVKQGREYFLREFYDPSGDYHDLVLAYRAASLFNPLKMKDKSLAELNVLVQYLGYYFGFEEFDTAFLQGVQDELVVYQDLMQDVFMWDEVDGASEYNADEDNKPWMQNHAEKARRVWIWWQLNRARLPKLAEALRLVALVQVSSASVERAFSTLRSIMEVVGLTKQPLHCNIALRLFEKLNDGHYLGDD